MQADDKITELSKCEKLDKMHHPSKSKESFRHIAFFASPLFLSHPPPLVVVY
jgi:hypothetical protein